MLLKLSSKSIIFPCKKLKIQKKIKFKSELPLDSQSFVIAYRTISPYGTFFQRTNDQKSFIFKTENITFNTN